MICHDCQQPIGEDETPVRTVGGEPVHPDCLEDDEPPDITPADVEGVREEVLDSIPDGASDEARSVAIDAVIEFDRRLTDPEFFRNDGH